MAEPTIGEDGITITAELQLPAYVHAGDVLILEPAHVWCHVLEDGRRTDWEPIPDQFTTDLDRY